MNATTFVVVTHAVAGIVGYLFAHRAAILQAVADLKPFFAEIFGAGKGKRK